MASVTGFVTSAADVSAVLSVFAVTLLMVLAASVGVHSGGVAVSLQSSVVGAVSMLDGESWT